MRSHRLYADPWLGGILHRDSFRLSFEHPVRNSPSDSLPAAGNEPAGQVFIHAKTDVSALAESAFLESQGFRLVDTNLTFERLTTSARKCEVKSQCDARTATQPSLTLKDALK